MVFPVCRPASFKFTVVSAILTFKVHHTKAQRQLKTEISNELFDLLAKKVCRGKVIGYASCTKLLSAHTWCFKFWYTYMHASDQSNFSVSQANYHVIVLVKLQLWTWLETVGNNLPKNQSKTWTLLKILHFVILCLWGECIEVVRSMMLYAKLLSITPEPVP